MKKKVTLLMVLIMLLSIGLLGCDKAGGNMDNNESLSVGLLDDDIVPLLGFENYGELHKIRVWGNMFGVASVNTNASYITQGSASMRVDIHGDYTSTNAYPFFIIDCAEGSVATDDFSSFEYISLDVYNATNKTLHIKMHLSVRGYSNKSEHTNAKVIELAPGQWTTAVYELQDGSIRKGFDNLEEVDGVIVQFLEYRTSQNDTPNTLYIDNLVGKTDSNPATYNPTRQTNELLFFENDGDINLFNTYALCLNVLYNADLSINTNSAFVSQGNKSMKCVFKYRYIYFDYFVQSKDIWIPLALNIGAFSNCRRITFDLFNGSGGTREIRVKYSYTNLLGSGTNTLTYTLANGEMRNIEVAVSGLLPRITALEIQTKPANGAEDIYYIDNIRGYN